MSIIAEVHVGEPSDDWRRPVESVEERVLIHFHNFADLPQQSGTGLDSPTFSCCGHEWYLWLFPRGDRVGRAREGMISVYLGTELTSKIVVDFDIILKKKTGESLTDIGTSSVKGEFPQQNNRELGWKNFASRDQILDESYNILNNGTLTFEVRIRPHEDYICRDLISNSSVAGDLYNNLYQDKDSASISIGTIDAAKVCHGKIYTLRTLTPCSLINANQCCQRPNVSP